MTLFTSEFISSTLYTKEYFEKEFNADNSDYIYVGCNEKLFRPIPVPKNPVFTVFWYGYANPLQGVEVILKAAEILKDKPIKFKIAGPVEQKLKSFKKYADLKNVEFINHIPYEQLPKEINAADLCLAGHFSNKQKAARVIAGKTFQFLATPIHEKQCPLLLDYCLALMQNL